MELVGYTDRMSVAPGESLSFMVSSKRPRYEARLVRLIHGDEHPDGPGFKEQELPSVLDGEYAGREGDDAEVSDPFGGDLDVYRDTCAELEALLQTAVERIVKEFASGSQR